MCTSLGLFYLEQIMTKKEGSHWVWVIRMFGMLLQLLFGSDGGVCVLHLLIRRLILCVPIKRGRGRWAGKSIGGECASSLSKLDDDLVGAKKHRYRQRSSSHMGRECVGDNPLGPMKCEERSRNVIKIKVNNKTYNAARMWNWNQCHNQNHCKDTVGWLV